MLASGREDLDLAQLVVQHEDLAGGMPHHVGDAAEDDLAVLAAGCTSGTGGETTSTAPPTTAGTTKHIGTSFTEAANVPDCMALAYEIAGGEAEFRARPFVSNSNCFVVPPMKFATESCEVMEACIRGGMPVLLLSAGMAGATAPATLAGAIMQAVAECLAGVVYVNAIAPGHPAIFGTWPFVSDLRTGAMSGGSAEQALLTAGCAQMHHFYGLPGGAAGGISDST